MTILKADQFYLTCPAMSSYLLADMNIASDQSQEQFFVKLGSTGFKENFVIYRISEPDEPVFRIEALHAISLNHAYKVTHSQSKHTLGYIYKEGISSLLIDKFHLKDSNYQNLATLYEGNRFLAFFRRFFRSNAPQTYVGEIDGKRVFHFIQKFSVTQYGITINRLATDIDPRMLLATGIILIFLAKSEH